MKISAANVIPPVPTSKENIRSNNSYKFNVGKLKNADYKKEFVSKLKQNN